MEDTPKSPKTPKLSEEISEMTIEIEAEKSMTVEIEAAPVQASKEPETVAEPVNEAISNEEVDIETCDDDKGEPKELDPRTKEILNELIQNSPAGQTQTVSSLCVELFGADYKEFVQEKELEKLVKDGMSEIEESSADEVDEEFKTELEAKLDSYIKELFPETGKHSIKQTSSDSWEIHIIGQRLKPKAFWSGHWHSIWSIQFKNEGEFSINGNVELTVHYHEEGSVQLSAKKEVTSRVDMKFDSKAQAADKIYWKIKDSEDTIQVALNEAYQQLGENIFKKLRRQLPVTRTKMDWAKFANYNLSTELKK